MKHLRWFKDFRFSCLKNVNLGQSLFNCATLLYLESGKCAFKSHSIQQKIVH